MPTTLRPSIRCLFGLVVGAMLTSAEAAEADEAPRALSHDAALRLAAERNLSLLSRSLDRTRTDAAADAARRPYLPELSAEAAVRETVGQKRRAVELLPSITYTTPYGTSMSAQGAVVEGVAENPENQRALTIELSQALLRGGFSGGASDLRQADIDVQIAKEGYRAALNELLLRADRAYWDLRLAREEVDIKRRSRDRARAQFEETQENIRRGLLAPGEIYVVEENLLDFQDRLSRAEESLALAESAMKRILYVAPTIPIEASSSIEVAAQSDSTEADSTNVAVTRNPNVTTARLAARRAQVGIGGERRQALPALDVFGSMSVASGQDPLAVPIPSDPELRAGVRVSIPLYWGPDAGRVRRAATEHEQRRLDLRDTEQSVVASVHEAAVRLRGRKQRLDLAARIVDLAQKKLDVERDKYKSGLSTLADVVRFQRELDDALSAALRARVDVLLARAEMLAARGDLHETLKVAIR